MPEGLPLPPGHAMMNGAYSLTVTPSTMVPAPLRVVALKHPNNDNFGTTYEVFAEQTAA